MLETLDYTIHIGSTPTILYFDFYLYSAYAGHYVYTLFSSLNDAFQWSITSSTNDTIILYYLYLF